MNQETDPSTEQLILETAEKLFLDKGYALTSTTEIAKEVGCNQALVHYYFRTKENLFNSIFEKRFRGFFEGVFSFNFKEEISFQYKIQRIVEAHFDLLHSNPKLMALIMTELLRRPEQLKNIRKNLGVVPEKVLSQLNKDLQNEIRMGRVQNDMTITDLVVTIVSLNAALFLLLPFAGEILDLDEKQKKAIIKRRRQENVKVILRYLGYSINNAEDP